MSDLHLTIKEVSFHRNGICGIGFYAIHFIDHDQTGADNKDAEMIGIVFDESGYCAVLQLNQPVFTVKFGVNSWRGDNYEGDLRKAIKKHKSSGSIRCGPFGIPTV